MASKCKLQKNQFSVAKRNVLSAFPWKALVPAEVFPESAGFTGAVSRSGGGSSSGTI